VILRFVQGSALTSKLIIAQEKTAMPFTPSHVEAVTPDGFYLGAHINGGVQKRPVGYDRAELVHELFLTLDATAEQDQTFYSYLTAHIGEPYDWRAILGFLFPEHEHLENHVICSAFMTLGLRAAKWFPYPLAAPAHLIDPRDLLLMLSGRMLVPMELSNA
jgi:hypothetical protein